jgi:hypothetical protein
MGDGTLLRRRLRPRFLPDERDRQLEHLDNDSVRPTGASSVPEPITSRTLSSWPDIAGDSCGFPESPRQLVEREDEDSVLPLPDPAGAHDAQHRDSAPGDTTFAGGVKAMPPARRHEQDELSDTGSSSFRSRRRSRTERSRPNRCPRVPASAASGAPATPPIRAPVGPAEPRPPSTLRSCSASPAKDSATHRARSRARRA